MTEPKTTLKLEPIEAGDYDRAKLEELVNQDMEAFAHFFREQLGNSTPTDYENYFLKTYLMWKIGTPMTT